ncbi:MAG: 50S ribosomal protein L10 [Erysipelotrichaceae bacterium]|jgi:large subunit ribosomal protein L10|nr:50S ribosomal protein L10 [Erysipelotrichaceae bacterium]
MNQQVLESKQALVTQIADKLKAATSSVIVEYRGLTVAEVTELRRKLRAEEIEFKVYKNSMVSRAVEVSGLSDLNDALTGPNAFAFSSDAVAPSRVLADFARRHKKLVIKKGVVDGKVVSAEEISQLAKLPNKEGMISMFMGTLNATVIKFACAVKAVAEQKEAAAN